MILRKLAREYFQIHPGWPDEMSISKMSRRAQRRTSAAACYTSAKRSASTDLPCETPRADRNLFPAPHDLPGPRLPMLHLAPPLGSQIRL
jgi:hypothetical protein